MNGISAKEFFAIKMHLNLNPLEVLALTFGLLLSMFSVFFYLSEIGIRHSGDYNRFEIFGNPVWVATQILLSAGVSGPEVPKSNLGKFIGIFANLGGVMIFCLFVTAVFNIGKLTSYEKEVCK